MLSFYSTADEIRDANADTAVLPVGSTEQHGAHLPVATDTIIAGALGENVARTMNALLLPALPVSTCREHMGKKGSIWMNPDTFYFMMRDMVMCLKEQGFRRVIVIQAHGGIHIMTSAIRELNATNADIKVIRIDLTQLCTSGELSSILTSHNNLHACEMETSLMLYLHEEWVRKDKIIDFVPPVPRDYLNYAPIFKYSPNGVWGMPSLATAEKGEKLMALLVEKSLTYIRDVEKYFENP